MTAADRRRARRTRRGVTLSEVLYVISILSLVMVLAQPHFLAVRRRLARRECYRTQVVVRRSLAADAALRQVASGGIPWEGLIAAKRLKRLPDHPGSGGVKAAVVLGEDGAVTCRFHGVAPEPKPAGTPAATPPAPSQPPPPPPEAPPPAPPPAPPEPEPEPEGSDPGFGDEEDFGDEDFEG